MIPIKSNEIFNDKKKKLQQQNLSLLHQQNNQILQYPDITTTK